MLDQLGMIERKGIEVFHYKDQKRTKVVTKIEANTFSCAYRGSVNRRKGSSAFGSS